MDSMGLVVGRKYREKYADIRVVRSFVEEISMK